MKLKLSIIIYLVFANFLFANKIVTAKKNINYKDIVKYEDVYIKEYAQTPPNCVLFDIEKLKSGEYIAKHFISKESVICDKDIEVYDGQKVLFNFGNIEIERKAKVIYENNEMIKIKEPNGNVEKIYKNGRIE